jgi:hypothetical protein
MANTAVILALARDCEKHLAKNINTLLEIGENNFSSFRIFIYSNDNSDTTPDILKSFNTQIDYQIDTLSLVRDWGVSASRANRMAFLRNKLLDNFKRNPADKLVMVDPDLSHIPVDTFWSMLDNSWDYIGSTGIEGKFPRLMYDTWAFLAQGQQRFKPSYYRLPSINGIMKVRSCFGGLAVIDGNAAKHVCYRPEAGCCEHAGVCLSLNNVGLNTEYRPVR